MMPSIECIGLGFEEIKLHYISREVYNATMEINVKQLHSGYGKRFKLLFAEISTVKMWVYVIRLDFARLGILINFTLNFLFCA